MVDLINKDGLSVSNNPKIIYEELFRKTGCVMGRRASIFIQNQSINVKYIMVSKDDGSDSPSERRFVSACFGEAQELFQQWLGGE
jgi:hypothetical protein